MSVYAYFITRKPRGNPSLLTNLAIPLGNPPCIYHYPVGFQELFVTSTLQSPNNGFSFIGHPFLHRSEKSFCFLHVATAMVDAEIHRTHCYTHMIGGHHPANYQTIITTWHCCFLKMSVELPANDASATLLMSQYNNTLVNKQFYWNFHFISFYSLFSG